MYGVENEYLRPGAWVRVHDDPADPGATKQLWKTDLGQIEREVADPRYGMRTFKVRLRDGMVQAFSDAELDRAKPPLSTGAKVAIGAAVTATLFGGIWWLLRGPAAIVTASNWIDDGAGGLRWGGPVGFQPAGLIAGFSTLHGGQHTWDGKRYAPTSSLAAGSIAAGNASTGKTASGPSNLIIASTAKPWAYYQRVAGGASDSLLGNVAAVNLAAADVAFASTAAATPDVPVLIYRTDGNISVPVYDTLTAATSVS